MNASRTFDEARRLQGFKSQAHLDAFYRSYDHKKSCPVCSKVGGNVAVFDGMQPYMKSCEEGQRLELESFQF